MKAAALIRLPGRPTRRGRSHGARRSSFGKVFPRMVDLHEEGTVMTEHDVVQDHDDEDGEDRGETTVVLDIADPAPARRPGALATWRCRSSIRWRMCWRTYPAVHPRDLIHGTSQGRFGLASPTRRRAWRAVRGRWCRRTTTASTWSLPPAVVRAIVFQKPAHNDRRPVSGFIRGSASRPWTRVRDRLGRGQARDRRNGPLRRTASSCARRGTTPRPGARARTGSPPIVPAAT